MKAQKDFAAVFGSIVVNGEKLEGKSLEDYLEQMPPEDFKSLLEDIATLEGL